jgi:hypothetical protein
MKMTLTSLLAASAIAGLVAINPAVAQQTAPATTEQKAVAKKQLAECKARSRETKLSFKKRRKFVEDCVAASAPR